MGRFKGVRTKFTSPEESILASQAKSPSMIAVCAPAMDQGEKKAKPQRENQRIFSAIFILLSLDIMKAQGLIFNLKD
ncbi:MAG: hypothetical protein AMJ91_00290 [candidate division Zixibacteria bacterium SM23_73_3]|nr:MAG: hypothetical protein AMJ91_00290 [candidate division Zixibacteria bacterium SM23_73_3]